MMVEVRSGCLPLRWTEEPGESDALPIEIDSVVSHRGSVLGVKSLYVFQVLPIHLLGKQARWSSLTPWRGSLLVKRTSLRCGS